MPFSLSGLMTLFSMDTKEIVNEKAEGEIGKARFYVGMSITCNTGIVKPSFFELLFEIGNRKFKDNISF